MISNALASLQTAGFTYKAAESPEIRAHLESRFLPAPDVGSRFCVFSDDQINAILEAAEDDLVEAFADQIRRTGRVERVRRIIAMPFVVGVDGFVARDAGIPGESLHLIKDPGTVRETIIEVLPCDADRMRITRQITITGGVYGDGATVGFYDVAPGDRPEGGWLYLVTDAELRLLAYEMEAMEDAIQIAPPSEVRRMLTRLAQRLGHLS